MSTVFRRSAFHILLISVIGILAYANTFNSPFYFDDIRNIAENPEIRDLGNFWPPSGRRYIGFLTFALNYSLGGLTTFGYHAFNLAVHILNALLIYSFLKLTFKTPWYRTDDGSLPAIHAEIGALAAAVIFVCHPLQTQAVTYIVQRFASLTVFFYLLSLVSYAASRLSTVRVRQGMFYVLSVFSAVMAMKTKEIAFTLPVIIMVYEFMFFKGPLKKRTLYLIPVVLTMLIIPAGMIDLGSPLQSAIQRAGDVTMVRDEGVAISRSTYVITQFRVIVTYLRLLFLPLNQTIDYDYPQYSSLFQREIVVSFLFLLSLIVLAVYFFLLSRTRDRILRLASFGILFFFIALTVESFLISIAHVIFEHRVYLPGIGIIIAVISCVLSVVEKRPAIMKPVLAGLVMISVLLAGMTFSRNAAWSSPIALWEDGVMKAPRRIAPHYYLGTAYCEQGRHKDGVKELQLASILGPDYPEIFFRIGQCYAEMEWLYDAGRALETAIQLRFNYPEAHFVLGTVYAGRGELDDAIREYRIALAQKPGYREARYFLSIALEKKKKRETDLRYQ